MTDPWVEFINLLAEAAYVVSTLGADGLPLSLHEMAYLEKLEKALSMIESERQSEAVADERGDAHEALERAFAASVGASANERADALANLAMSLEGLRRKVERSLEEPDEEEGW